MEYFVTGATGFIGKRLVKTLLARRGARVHFLVRPGSEGKVADLLQYWGVSKARALPVSGDLTAKKLGVTPEAMKALKGQIDAVYHLAAVYDLSADAESQIQVNVDGTRNVVEAALAAKAPRLVFTSSQAALGFGEGQTPVDETHAFNLAPAVYPYGHSKHLAEQVVQGAVARGLHAVIVNPSIVLGPRDVTLYNSRVILEVQAGRLPLVPPGGVNVVAALDVARGHLLALEKGQPGQRYLLAGHNVTLLDLTRRIAAMLGVRGPWGALPERLVGPLAAALDGANRLAPRRLPLAGDVLRFGSRFIYADNRKPVAELGWTVTPLEETIEQAVAWLRAEGAI